jgi:mono/diheme cytochrome c family protein
VRHLSWLAALAALLLFACNQPNRAEQDASAPTPSASASAASPVGPTVPVVAIANEPRGDAERGRALVESHQCNRCHGGLAEVTPTPMESHCTTCHEEVLAGRFDHKEESARWKKNVLYLTETPTLEAIGKRYAYGWIVRFLLDPHDLRPHLTYSMPALDLDEQKARDIATYLVGNDAPAEGSLAGANAARGRALLDDKGCTGCHSFSGVPALSSVPSLKGLSGDALRAVELAPDLRHARERMTPGTLIAWVTDPASIQPKTRMPKLMLEPDEARDIAAYVLTTPLEARAKAKPTAMPAALDRKVAYAEIAEKLFDVTCRHCHGNPDVALGDGGPGNTGGFGYQPRGLELTSYERVNAGYLEGEERHSVFAKMPDGTPRLVASLLARHDEVAGLRREGIRGMPLALPPVPMKDIQLLVTWIEQGRPR